MTETLIKKPEPGGRYSDTDKAHALGVFLDCHGDLMATSRALGGTPPLERIRYGRHEYDWDVYLEQMRKRLTEDTVDEVTKRKRQDLAMLTAAKVQLAFGITGKKNAAGEFITQPLKPRTLESAATALARVIELTYRIQGDDLGDGSKEQTGNFFLTLIRNAMGEADNEIRALDGAETSGPPAGATEAGRIGADTDASPDACEGRQD